MIFEYLSRGKLVAAGLMKGAMVSGTALVATDTYAQMLQGDARLAIEELMRRPLTDEVRAWIEPEAFTHSSARNSLLKSRL